MMRSAMSVLVCTVLTAALCVPSLLRLPQVMPFADSAVQAAAPQAMEALRTQGWWLVHAHLTDNPHSCPLYRIATRPAPGEKTLFSTQSEPRTHLLLNMSCSE